MTTKGKLNVWTAAEADAEAAKELAYQERAHTAGEITSARLETMMDDLEEWKHYAVGKPRTLTVNNYVGSLGGAGYDDGEA